MLQSSTNRPSRLTDSEPALTFCTCVLGPSNFSLAAKKVVSTAGTQAEVSKTNAFMLLFASLRFFRCSGSAKIAPSERDLTEP
jgi:hypothetical protein